MNNFLPLSCFSFTVMVALVSITPAITARASAWPLQLEMRVPFEPTAFPSDGRTYLAYELHLTNSAADPLTLRRIEVQDADTATARPIAALEGERLDAVLQSVGPGQSGNPREIAGGGSVVVFLWLVLDRGAQLPKRLRHQVFTMDSAVVGAVIGTHHTELKVLGSPVQGSNWTASDGPSNDRDNHHRRGIFVFDGIASCVHYRAVSDGEHRLTVGAVGVHIAGIPDECRAVFALHPIDRVAPRDDWPLRDMLVDFGGASEALSAK